MKNYILFILMFISMPVMAGGLSSLATPTGIDIARNDGFMMYGNFGNPAGCTTSNSIFIKIDHPQYNQIYSTVLASFMSGKKIEAYAHVCEPVGWFSASSVTYNILTPGGALNIRN